MVHPFIFASCSRMTELLRYRRLGLFSTDYRMCHCNTDDTLSWSALQIDIIE